MIDGYWLPIRDGDLRGLALYQRHYSSAKSRGIYRHVAPVGNRAKFVGKGEHMVLLTPNCDALWTWRRQVFRKDGQSGIECAIFRNEGLRRSSELIREAVDLAWQRWPGERLFTYVADAKIRSTNPGYCFKKAGWRTAGRNKDGRLTILELLPDEDIVTKQNAEPR